MLLAELILKKINIMVLMANLGLIPSIKAPVEVRFVFLVKPQAWHQGTLSVDFSLV